MRKAASGRGLFEVSSCHFWNVSFSSSIDFN